MEDGVAREIVSREVYNAVIAIATIPALAFVIWLSWVITNKLMSPDYQQKKRAKEIRKAQAERAALMAELHPEAQAAPDREKPAGGAG